MKHSFMVGEAAYKSKDFQSKEGLQSNILPLWK